MADRINTGEMSDNLRQACRTALSDTICWDVAANAPLPSFLFPADRGKMETLGNALLEVARIVFEDAMGPRHFSGSLHLRESRDDGPTEFFTEQWHTMEASPASPCVTAPTGHVGILLTGPSCYGRLRNRPRGNGG